MIKTVHQISNIQFSIAVNSFIYFLKKMPLVKRLFKNINYSFMKFKNVLGAFSIIYKIISAPIKSFIVFLLTMFLPVFLVFNKSIDIKAIFALMFSFYLVLNFIHSNMLATDRETFILVKQMKMPPKEYFLAKTIQKETVNFIGKFIVFSIFFSFFDFNLFFGIKLALILCSMSIASEALYLFLFDKKEFNINNKNILQISLYILVVVATYLATLLFKIEIYFSISYFIFTNIIVFLVFLSLGVLSTIYIYKYDNFWNVVNYKNNATDLEDVEQIIKDAEFNNVKLNEKDYSSTDLNSNKFNEREGYDYLNSIFFERHKKIIYTQMRVRSAIVVLAFIVLFLIDFFVNDFSGNKLVEITIDKYTIFVFTIYMLSNSEKIIKSLFYNCDISLLRYGFYKQSDALLKMFFLRLKKIINCNIVPTLVLCLGLVLITFIYDPSRIMNMIPVLLFIIVLNLFFSIHYIFMYYIFQPYTTDLKVKNPFYKIINFIIYMTAYMSIQIDAPAKIFLPFTVGAAIIYMLIAIVLVYKKAPQTFRTK